MAGGVRIGNIAGFLADALRRGVSSTSALSEFRRAGGAIRTQTWYRVAGEVRAAIGNVGRLGGIDYGSPMGDDLYTGWSAGSSGQQLYQFQLEIGRSVEVAPGQRQEFIEHVQASVVSDHDLTPDEAAAAAIADAEEQGPDTDAFTIRGAILTGAYRLTGGTE